MAAMPRAGIIGGELFVSDPSPGLSECVCGRCWYTHPKGSATEGIGVARLQPDAGDASEAERGRWHPGPVCSRCLAPVTPLAVRTCIRPYS